MVWIVLVAPPVVWVVPLVLIVVDSQRPVAGGQALPFVIPLLDSFLLRRSLDSVSPPRRISVSDHCCGRLLRHSPQHKRKREILS